MKLFLVYPLAALFEIAGCFAFWAWWRLEKSPLWLLPGMVSLALFAWLLTHQGEHTSSDLYGIPPHGVCHADELLYMWSPVFFDNYEFSGKEATQTSLLQPISRFDSRNCSATTLMP